MLHILTPGVPLDSPGVERGRVGGGGGCITETMARLYDTSAAHIQASDCA